MKGSPQPLQIETELLRYVRAHGTRQDSVLADVERQAAALGSLPAAMQVSPEEGALLELLARMLGARRALEVGTMTGYSTICIARGLEEHGTLVTLELDEANAELARRNLDRAGVGDRVEIVVGHASETLRKLPEEPSCDFAFIDADKGGYPDYYEQVLRRLRRGGLVVIDNVLLQGRVLRPEGDDDAGVVHSLNRRIADDARVDCVMVAMGDGMTFARKR